MVSKEDIAAVLSRYLQDLFDLPAEKITADARLGEDLDLELATQELLVLIDGISVERVHFPKSVSPARQLELLERRLSLARSRDDAGAKLQSLTPIRASSHRRMAQTPQDRRSRRDAWSYAG